MPLLGAHAAVEKSEVARPVDGSGPTRDRKFSIDGLGVRSGRVVRDEELVGDLRIGQVRTQQYPFARSARSPIETRPPAGQPARGVHRLAVRRSSLARARSIRSGKWLDAGRPLVSRSA